MMSRPRALAIFNGLGLLASALVLASGIIWYPMIEVAVFAPLPLLCAVVVGFWLGASWPARLALGVGNAAVIVGVAGILTLYGIAGPGSIAPVLFYGAALMMALGYALIGGSLVRGILTRGIRSV